MADIKAYKPERSSVGSGQVLHTPYTYEKAKLVVQEMTELLVLDLVEKMNNFTFLTLKVLGLTVQCQPPLSKCGFYNRF